MYWQKRFTREDPDLAIKIEIEEIRKTNPNYGYRRLLPLLKLKGIVINKKKLQRIIKKFKLQITTYSRKSRKYNSYKGKIGKGMTLTARFYLLDRTLWQLLFDRVDDWFNPNLKNS